VSNSAVPAGADNPGNYCYRHPNRQSYILCQRCGRTICTDCQTQAAVGVHCPECTREARQSIRGPKPRVVTAFSRTSTMPVVTYAIIAITLLVFLGQWLSGGALTNALLYWPPITEAQPWRMITTMFVHSQSSIFHVVLNMFSLYIFGPILERLVGRWRFLALYLLSGLGGSVAVLLLSPSSAVLGASGAIFGLVAAFFIIQRHFGGNTTTLVVVIAINLGLGFIVPQVAWQAHVGGLVVGAIIAFIMVRTRRIDQRRLQGWLIAAVGVALVVLTVAGVAYWF
jgi:membrane associated rhomboid family serine protease